MPKYGLRATFRGMTVFLGIACIVLAVALICCIVALTTVIGRNRRASEAPLLQIEAAPSKPEIAPSIPTDRVWIVVNPTKPQDYPSFQRTVNRICEAMTDHPAQWLETTVEDPGTGQTIEALRHQPRLVLAAGGDGTVRAVAAGMAHSGVPMGIVPAGTGNLLARNLKLPLDLESALEVAIAGADRAIDIAWMHTERVVVPAELPAEGGLLAQANASEVRTLPDDVEEPRLDEYAYLVIAGVGFDGETMANTSARLKKAVGWSAYVFTSFKSLQIERMKATITVFNPAQSAPPHRLSLLNRRLRSKISDAITESHTIGREGSPAHPVHTEETWQMSVLRARTVLFANVGELPFANLAPHAAIDDGDLDIIAIDTHAGILGWLSLAAKVLGQAIGIRMYNRPGSLGQMSFSQTPKARLDINRAYPVQVDGDPIGTARTVIGRVDHSALLIRIPAGDFQ